MRRDLSIFHERLRARGRLLPSIRRHQSRHCSSRRYRGSSSGPAQKFILRQIKVLDSIALGEKPVTEALPSNWNGAAPVINAGTGTSEAQATAKTGEIGIDVCLLTIYGHILFSTTSYTYALSYFARAATLDPENPMINLQLWPGLHPIYAPQAPAQHNRQYLLTQGFAFLFSNAMTSACGQLIIWRDPGGALQHWSRLQHAIGLGHVAVEYYMKVLSTRHARRGREKSASQALGRERACYRSGD